MLELRHLNYSVTENGETNDIIRDVSLTVPDGKLLVLTGPNGGGKTTLAKLIMGLVQPTAGTILWNGEDVTGLDLTERAKKGISYGFQQPPRFKGIKVGDLLSIASGKKLLRRGVSTQQHKAREPQPRSSRPEQMNRSGRFVRKAAHSIRPTSRTGRRNTQCRFLSIRST